MGCSSSKKCDLSACNSCPWGCTCVNWSTSFDGDDSVCEETLNERLQCGVNTDEASGHMHCQCGRLIWGSILLVVVLTSLAFYFRARRTNKPQNYKFLGTCLGFGLTCLINVCIPTVELPNRHLFVLLLLLRLHGEHVHADHAGAFPCIELKLRENFQSECWRGSISLQCVHETRRSWDAWSCLMTLRNRGL